VRDGESVNFDSSMIPRYLRRSLSISARTACAYLKGTSERVVASVLEVALVRARRSSRLRCSVN